MKPLRFATLIRVSTEKQEEQGESLRVQTTQMTDAITATGGKVAREYGGQEHATAGWERDELERLMADAMKEPKPFDAVMVAHPDRWSRDNAQSKPGLRTLAEAGVRFFVCGTEYDLHDPSAILFLGMSAEIGEFVAATQAGKSMASKLARARRGIPASGALPFGRTFDRGALAAGTAPAKCWALDQEKAQWVKEWAVRYLEDGDGFTAIAADYPVTDDLVRRTLLERAGADYPMRFKGKRPGEFETVVVTVPRLLPEKTIAKIKEQCKANMKRPKGRKPLAPYLLNGYVFCSYCGKSLNGQTHHGGRQRYYTHAKKHKAKLCTEKGGMSCNGPALDAAVLQLLYETLGDTAATRQAMERAEPKLGDREKMEAKLERARQKVARADAGKKRLVDFVANGTFTDEEVAAKAAKLGQDRAAALEVVATLETQLATIPDKKALRAVVKLANGQIKKKLSARKAVAADAKWQQTLAEMSWEDKRELIETVFAGPTVDGKRPGVYVSWVEGEREKPLRWGGKTFAFTLQGALAMPADAGGIAKGGAKPRAC